MPGIQRHNVGAQGMLFGDASQAFGSQELGGWMDVEILLNTKLFGCEARFKTDRMFLV